MGFFSWLFGIDEVMQQQRETHAMVTQAFRELKELVEHSAGVQASAVELLRGLADKLADLAKHPSAADIRALAADIRQQAQELSGAVALHKDKDEEEEEKEEDEDEEEHGGG